LLSAPNRCTARYLISLLSSSSGSTVKAGNGALECGNLVTTNSTQTMGLSFHNGQTINTDDLDGLTGAYTNSRQSRAKMTDIMPLARASWHRLLFLRCGFCLGSDVGLAVQ
jgi:hypothetical protein